MSRHILEQDAFVLLQMTADRQAGEFAALLKPAGISATQYNALRILRGARTSALPLSAIAERMITRDPDITRLIDRMEAKGWVIRGRHPEDRRVILARISPAGLALLASLDQAVLQLHRRQFTRLGPARLKTLCRLLAES